MTDLEKKYHRDITNPLKYKLFLISKLPSLWFWGVSLTELSVHRCTCSMKLKWQNQNPFGSMYFSALNGAAELSTGILLQLALSQYPKYSMLVTNFKAEFFKKSVGTLQFTCSDGEDLRATIAAIVANPEKKGSFVLKSMAIDEHGVTTAQFEVGWSIMIKV